MRRRRTIGEHGIVSTRVRPGHDVELIDVSAGGALIECMRGLSPGALIELSLTAGEHCTSVRGRVLRCVVVRVQPTAVSYRGAIAFDRDLHWFSEHDTTGHPRESRKGVTP